jgi:hypothetical protein
MAVRNVSTYRAVLSRTAEVMELFRESKRFHEGLGARVSVSTAVIGGTAGTYLYVTEVDDIAAWGALEERIAAARDTGGAPLAAALGGSDPPLTIEGRVLIRDVSLD